MLSRAFYKQLLFISIASTIILVGGLAIYSATSSGNLKMTNQENATTTSNNPIGWWKMDEGTGQYAYDVSGNGNTGTLGTSTNAEPADPTWATGKLGKGLSFDGVNDYVSVADNNTLDTIGDYTISMWFKNGAGSKTYPTLLNRGGQSADGYFWIYTAGTNERDLIFQWSNGVDFGPEVFSSVLAMNTWQNILFTFDNTTKALKLFVNGAQQGTTKTLANYNAVDDGVLYIGTYSTLSTNYPILGLIDDVRIYNRALSAGEVAQQYNSTKDGYLGNLKMANQENATTTSNNPVGWWKMDEGTGITTVDSSGNGKTGTLTGPTHLPTWTTGKLGKAVNFDGVDDYVDVGIINAIRGVSQFTISGWVKRSSADGSLFWFREDAISECIAATWTSNVLYIMVVNGAASGYVADVADNTWKHYTVVFDGTQPDNAGKIKIYINGVAKTLSFEGTILALTSDPYVAAKLGSNTTWNANYLAGSLDDVRIYNRALSAAEMAQMYNSTKDGYLGNIKVSTGLVGYWKLDDNAANTTVKDYSGKNNTGTFSDVAGDPNTSAHSTAGQIGSAMTFDRADDYVGIPYNSILNPSIFTLSAWVKITTSFAEYDQYAGIASTIDNTTQTKGYALQIRRTTHKFGFYIGGSLIVSNEAAIPGNWYHVVGVCDGATISLYVNGIKQIETANVTIILNPNLPLNIGALLGDYTDGYLWSGLIDDVKIYNYARTAEQIYNNYVLGTKHREE